MEVQLFGLVFLPLSFLYELSTQVCPRPRGLGSRYYFGRLLLTDIDKSVSSPDKRRIASWVMEASKPSDNVKMRFCERGA